MRRKTDPAAVSLFLQLLEATNGKRQIKTRNTMTRQVFTRMPWESEEDARRRLALERGDFRTDLERAEDRESDTLRELRKNNQNPNL